jgi:ubiquinone/menaquinone biosynthesis C-methylase UbiE
VFTERQTVVVPPELLGRLRASISAIFRGVNRADPELLARDFLDDRKSHRRAEILQRYAAMRGTRLLEVGSGCGMNLVVWIRDYGVEGYGIEPGGFGFESSLRVSRELLAANGLNPSRIQDAAGESLPYADASFDIVYSANVLEHTQEPRAVLEESVRVLKPGGLLHFEMPNFLSYFEGHYLVPQPPVLWNGMLAAWVKYVFRRDPAFARSLRTEINPVWCRSVFRDLSRRRPLTLVSLGEEVFLERLARPFEFETGHVGMYIGGLVRMLQRLNVANWIGHLLVGLKGYYPIYLTIQKAGRLAGEPTEVGKATR